MCETGGIWEISAPSSQFYCEPKMALKKLSLKNASWEGKAILRKFGEGQTLTIVWSTNTY